MLVGAETRGVTSQRPAKSSNEPPLYAFIANEVCVKWKLFICGQMCLLSDELLQKFALNCESVELRAISEDLLQRNYSASYCMHILT